MSDIVELDLHVANVTEKVPIESSSLVCDEIPLDARIVDDAADVVSILEHTEPKATGDDGVLGAAVDTAHAKHTVVPKCDPVILAADVGGGAVVDAEATISARVGDGKPPAKEPGGKL